VQRSLLDGLHLASVKLGFEWGLGIIEQGSALIGEIVQRQLA
jgi:hypothetical protein